MDVVAVTLAVALVLVTSFGMFGDVQGGHQPSTAWIAWHAVLMSLGFPCLMVMGRWVYVADESILGSSKGARRQVHRALMMLAVSVVLVGYVCIFKAHLPSQKFFGYDFKRHVWAVPVRILHVYVGYTAILLCVSQAVMGMVKYYYLSGYGQRVLTFHGKLGKVILLLGCTNMILAAKFWAWGVRMKASIYVLAVVCALLGMAWPSVQLNSDEDAAERRLV